MRCKMTNMIQSAKDQVSQLTQQAYERAAAAGALPAGAQVNATIEIPKDTAHGDYATSFAMAGAKAMHMAPRAIAQAIVDHLELEGSYFQKVEIAGPGFLNFTLGPKWFGDVLSSVETEGASYGAMTVGVNTRHLLAELDDQGGDIEIDYAIEIDHAIAGRNIFQIKVKEADGISLKQ